MLPKISIVICTYNRCQILRGCLDSLTQQTVNEKADALPPFEVIIVDNNSPDATAAVSSEYTAQYAYFRYIFEPNVGHSAARNRGFMEAHADWVLYLDDDVKVFQNLVERAIFTAENYGFECFGGIIHTFYLQEKPRWIAANFLSNQYLLEQYLTKTPTEISDEKLIWGCLIAFRKDLLYKFGGFKTDLGMKGDKMGYFDETDMILNVKNAGYRMGLDPEMRLYHLIPDFKLNLSWHLKECFVSGRDGYRYWAATIPSGKIGFLGYMLKRLVTYLRFFYNALKKWIRQDDFYWQNGIIQTLRPVLFDLGIIARKINPKR